VQPHVISSIASATLFIALAIGRDLTDSDRFCQGSLGMPRGLYATSRLSNKYASVNLGSFSLGAEIHHQPSVQCELTPAQIVTTEHIR
jgi:hypothetical protein